MPGGYNLRSTRSVQLEQTSPLPTEEDDLNATMMEPPTVSNQLADVIASLENLTRVVVESRHEIDLLKQQIRNNPSTTDLNNGRRNVIFDTASNRNSPRDCIEDLQNEQNVVGISIDPVPNISGCQEQNIQQMSQSFEAKYKLYDLPPFSGNVDEWPLFIANFKDTTDAFKYNNRHNLMRLQKCLSGPAREAVASMLVYPNDVPNVIEELQFRFGRPEILVRSQLQKIQQFPTINRKKMDQIINFSTKVRNVVAFLSSASCSHHLMSTTLLEEMVSKLPEDQQFEWVKKASTIKPFPSVVDFSKWLGDLAKIVSLMPQYTPSPQNQPVKQMVVNDGNKKLNPKCDICSGDHLLTACKVFTDEMDLKKRWEKVKQLKLCFSCLRKGHGVNKCYSKKVCNINRCKKYHHKILHKDETETVDEANSGEQTAAHTLSCRKHLQASKIFKTLPVTLFGPSGSFKTYAMFDEGSSISLIDVKTANILGLKGKSTNLTLQWYGEETVTEDSSLVSLEIEGMCSPRERFSLKNIHTIKKLDLPCQSFSKSCSSDFENLPLEDYYNAKPVLLIGLDNAHLGAPICVRESQDSDLIAMQCKLGWLTYGLINKNPNQPTVLLVKDDELNNIVSDFLNTENFGVNTNIKPLLSDDDQVAKNTMESTIRRVGKRYEIGLLWKEYPPVMPPNYKVAENRLKLTEKKMIQDAQYAEKYKLEIDKYIQKGYARKLSQEEVNQTQYPVWYLPHFGVVNIHKPDKLRVVFDAASKTSGVSLNSLLLKGPEQAKPLIGILLKFRQGIIGVAADIREMFSQIKIRQEDQHAQRFLWRGGNVNRPIEQYVMVSMTFGAICSPCCAEYIKNVNAIRFEDIYPEASKAIVEKHYVDDFVCSFSNEDDAIAVCQQVVEIHSDGGFELRGFTSNNEKLEAVMNYPCSKSMELINMEKQSTTQKILGMYWDKTTDVFQFKTKFHGLDQDVLNGFRVPTKRELLKIAMAVFDPYGLLADFLLYTKIIMQELWKKQIGWDDPIPFELHRKWLIWWNEFKNIDQFKIPRCLSAQLFTSNIQLHIFVDASQQAFSSVCYFRIQYENGIDVSFVMGKVRCAPIKVMSIPRLELQAAVLGVRLSKLIQQNHEVNISSTYFWSDSQTVIQWIKSTERRYKAFVSHRIAEILNASTPQQWRYVPTQQNSADAGTRALFPPKINSQGVWVSGPKFLQCDEGLWPKDIVELTKISTEEEIITSLVIKRQTTIPILEYNRFSSLKKLTRTLAWVIRFGTHNRNCGPLQPSEITNAEKVLCKIVQSECYLDEINSLKCGNQISKSSSIYTLVPYMDDEGILRIRGRLDEALYLPLDARRPIIMPPNHIVSELIITHYHIINHHQNMNLTINESRQKYWIIRVKSLFKKVKRKCLICKYDTIQPKTPLMGQLPPDRITPFVRPFTYTGVDLFGPFNVSIGRRREKRWAVLFTCLTIRAAHIEIVDELSTDAFILCLRNFVNRRGTPVRIRSDNGTNFIGAQKLLKKENRLFDVDKIQEEATNKNIEWLFNCPGNPSSGGVWERLIRIIKRILNKTLKDTAPRVETLRSLLIEAENIINSRPLTDIPISSFEDEPLTPNHFLIGCVNSTQTPSNSDENICLRKQWRIAQNLKDRFWKQWVRDYLPQLIQMPKWRKNHISIKVGDIVIIFDSNLPRNQWLKGRIKKVYPAKDGIIRFADIETSTGIIRRPTSKLAVLNIENGESG